jgi:hypothetical protein
LGADAAGRGGGGLVGLPLFAGQLPEGVNGAGSDGEEFEGGETGLGSEFVGAGGTAPMEWQPFIQACCAR